MIVEHPQVLLPPRHLFKSRCGWGKKVSVMQENVQPQQQTLPPPPPPPPSTLPPVEGGSEEDHRRPSTRTPSPSMKATPPPIISQPTPVVVTTSSGGLKNGHVIYTKTPTTEKTPTTTTATGEGMDTSEGGGGRLRHSSSCESLSDSHPYTVPVKYRSGVGNFEESIACGFANLYSSPILSDVTIACEGKLMKAHKIVLAISSPYFRQIFEELTEYPCQHPVIILHGVKLKDWENIMRLIYHGIAHVRSNEIEDFIAAAECLKIDGLSAEDPASAEDVSVTPPYVYGLEEGRLGGDFPPSPEEEEEEESETVTVTGGVGVLGKVYRQQQQQQQQQQQVQRPPPMSEDEEEEEEEDFSPSRRYEFSPSQPKKVPNSVRVISSAQSSPGLGAASGRETVENYRREDPEEEIRPPSCPEALRVYTSTMSASLPVSQPAPHHQHSESRSGVQVHAVRHPVISRRRGGGASSPDLGESGSENMYESVQAINTTTSSSKEALLRASSPKVGMALVMGDNNRPRDGRTFGGRFHPYSAGGWAESGRSEAVVIDDSSSCDAPRREFLHESPSTNSQGTSIGVNTRYPLSVISRQPPASIPLQLLSPSVAAAAAAAGFLHRMPPLQLLNTTSQEPPSPGGSEPPYPGVITSPSPQSQAQSQSTLALLRAKIAAGQSVYSRGYRPDRHHHYLLHRYSSSSSAPSPTQQQQVSPPLVSPRPFGGDPQAAAAAAAAAAIARPKTKAIRSSQVPQSARYTAAEVDSMVDKVQNFPGNMVPCAICSKFVKRERLRAHIHECHLLQGKRIQCPHCGIGLKSKGSYRVHIWRHKRGALPSAGGRQQQQQQPPPPPHHHQHHQQIHHPHHNHHHHHSNRSLTSRGSSHSPQGQHQHPYPSPSSSSSSHLSMSTGRSRERERDL